VPSETTDATGLAGPYAAALCDLAEAGGLLDTVNQDLAGLAAMIRESDDLTRLIRSPVIGRRDQGRALAALMQAAGTCDLAQRFVGLVASNRRLFALPDMIAAFAGLLAARRGEVSAEVTSARALSQRQVAALGDALRRALGTAVAVDARVEPALLGGLVVKVGSRMVDSSIRAKLQRMRLAMMGVG
jgi:F-type H+-transporting ATPase subunit delta